MLQGALLGLIDILHHGAGGNDACGIVLQPQSHQGSHLKMLHQDTAAGFLTEKAAVQGRNNHLIAVFQLVHIHARHVKGIVADNLRRGKFVDFVKQFPVRIHLSHHEIPGTDIRGGYSVDSIHIYNSHQVIVLCLIQHLGAGYGSRSHHPDYLTLHQALGLPGILHLLCYSDLISLLDQAVQVGIQCVKRHPAHRCPLRKTAVLSCKGYLQFL